MRRVNATISLVFIIVLTLCAGAQNLPRKIRGYTVYDAHITVNNKPVSEIGVDSDAVVSLGEPRIADVSISGITFEIEAEIKAADQSGTVDFLSFHDFRINGIPVTVNEYREMFAFKKHTSVKLPKPASVFLPTTQIVNAALKEMRESKKEWTITGRVFVFGKFRKFGFNRKRVVPILINLTIPNPLIL